MENETFKLGDVVVLKSGSLPMTVTELHGNSCWVVWSDVSNNIIERSFKNHSIQKVPDGAIS